jgi:RNA polymerase sigma factor (sigma-70 family)
LLVKITVFQFFSRFHRAVKLPLLVKIRKPQFQPIQPFHRRMKWLHPLKSFRFTGIVVVVCWRSAGVAAPFDRLIRENDSELVREVLATLTPRENKILAMRFGLDDGRPKTLEEIGDRLGVTRERIRQIQEEALQKMRVKIAEHETPAVETAVMAA